MFIQFLSKKSCPCSVVVFHFILFFVKRIMSGDIPSSHVTTWCIKLSPFVDTRNPMFDWIQPSFYFYSIACNCSAFSFFFFEISASSGDIIYSIDISTDFQSHLHLHIHPHSIRSRVVTFPSLAIHPISDVNKESYHCSIGFPILIATTSVRIPLRALHSPPTVTLVVGGLGCFRLQLTGSYR